jgi:hypothetical protein
MRYGEFTESPRCSGDAMRNLPVRKVAGITVQEVKCPKNRVDTGLQADCVLICEGL